MENLIKSKTIILRSGYYELKSRNFDFSLKNDIVIFASQKKTFLLISGENGAGKTTFLEQVIIPALLNNSVIFSYIGQDRDIQDIVNRSLEAIISVTKKKKSKIFNNFKDKSANSAAAEILLLDETDKLLDIEKLYEMINNPDYKLIGIISHDMEKMENVIKSKKFDEIIKLDISAGISHRIVTKV